MKNKPFEQEFKGTLKQRFAIRRKLSRPFIEKYGNPIIVHAINKEEIFKKILQEGKLKVPKEHDSPKKCPYMEKILKIDNGIYYSLGFTYLINYNWNYNLIFDIHYLKNLRYYKNNINFHAYRIIIDYWNNNDRLYLEKLANLNEICRQVIDKYYDKKGFDFWKIEKYVFEFIQNYPKKKELYDLIKKLAKSYEKKFPSSIKDAKKAYFEQRTPEIIGIRENNLLRNKYFLGFYIREVIDKKILKILKKKYLNKVIFDGNKITRIKEL